MSTATHTSPTVDIARIQEVPGRIVAAWSAHDADAFAAAFTEDGTMTLPGFEPSQGRDAVRTFMAAAFAGPYRGTQVTGDPVSMRLIAADVAVVVTRGGILGAGETEIPPERAVNATWVIARDGDDWSLAAYHNSPAGG